MIVSFSTKIKVRHFCLILTCRIFRDTYSDTSITISVSPLQTTNYNITVTDANGCTAFAENTVLVIDSCDTSTADTIQPLTNTFYLPNIFSPNDDSKNDILFVRGRNIKEIDFFIYDRWGEEIFHTTDTSIGWDGTFRGKPLNSAVFVYFLTVKYFDGNIDTAKGNITLIR